MGREQSEDLLSGLVGKFVAPFRVPLFQSCVALLFPQVLVGVTRCPHYLLNKRGSEPLRYSSNTSSPIIVLLSR